MVNFGLVQKGPRGASKLYRLAHDLTCDILLEDISISNGIGWSLDHRFFFHTDSLDHSIYRYTLQGKKLKQQRNLLQLPRKERRDGLTIDADGNLWVAIVGWRACCSNIT